MQKQTAIASIYFVILLILCSGPLAFAENNGTFTVVKGDIQVTSASGTTEKARVGKKVNPSDVITAGPDSRAKIVMADKNIINISPDTKMALEKYIFDPSTDNKQVTLNVLYGKVRATVEQKYDGEKNKFHIKTPAAVAGVRGTDFLTSYSQATKETKIVTFEGRVAVGSPGPNGQIVNPVYVTPGQMTTASKGAPPAPPIAVPAEEFKQLNNESQADLGKKEPVKAEPAEKKNQEEKSDDKKEDSKKEDVKKDEPKKEEANKDDSKKQETSGDKPKNQDEQSNKKEVSSSDETKREEPRKEDTKREDQADRKEPGKDTGGEKRQGNQDTGDAKAGKSTESKADTASNPPKENGRREPASANSTSGPNGPGPVAGEPKPPAPRAPGELMSPPAPGTLMLDRTDLAPNISKDVMSPTIQNALPVVNNFTPNLPATPPTQQYINQINQIIQNTNSQSKVNIIIKRSP